MFKMIILSLLFSGMTSIGGEFSFGRSFTSHCSYRLSNNVNTLGSLTCDQMAGVLGQVPIVGETSGEFRIYSHPSGTNRTLILPTVQCFDANTGASITCPASPPSPATNSATMQICTNIPIKVVYQFIYDVIGSINDLTVYAHVGEAPAEFTQIHEVIFTQVNANLNAPLSGNPGYIFGKPVVAAKEIPSAILSTSVLVQTAMTMVPTTNTQVPYQNQASLLQRSTGGVWNIPAGGTCPFFGQQMDYRVEQVRFGEDSYGGCLLNFPSVEAIISPGDDWTGYCTRMQNLILDLLKTPAVVRNSQLGNTYYAGQPDHLAAWPVSKTNESDQWVPIQNLQATPSLAAPTGTAGSCRGLLVGQDIEIQYAKYGSLVNPQNRIVGARVGYIQGDVFFDTSRTGVEITVRARFTDVTPPVSLLEKARPWLITELPSWQIMLKEGGITALWRGNGVNVLKNGPESALRFGLHGLLKSSLFPDAKDLKPEQRLLVASMAGAISLTCTYPAEILKTRMALRKSTDPRSIMTCLRRVYKQGGLLGFYRGYKISMLSYVPYSGMELAIYEVFARRLTEELLDYRLPINQQSTHKLARIENACRREFPQFDARQIRLKMRAQLKLYRRNIKSNSTIKTLVKSDKIRPLLPCGARTNVSEVCEIKPAIENQEGLAQSSSLQQRATLDVVQPELVELAQRTEPQPQGMCFFPLLAVNDADGLNKMNNAPFIPITPNSVVPIPSIQMPVLTTNNSNSTAVFNGWHMNPLQSQMIANHFAPILNGLLSTLPVVPSEQPDQADPDPPVNTSFQIPPSTMLPDDMSKSAPPEVMENSNQNLLVSSLRMSASMLRQTAQLFEMAGLTQIASAATAASTVSPLRDGLWPVSSLYTGATFPTVNGVDDTVQHPC